MYHKTFGSRSEVFSGVAKMTRGRLTKDKLTRNRYGKVVSLAKSEQSKKNNSGDRLKKFHFKRKDGNAVADEKSASSQSASGPTSA